MKLAPWQVALTRYINSVAPPSCSTNLLSNYACEVGQRGERRLYCKCTGWVFTAVLAISALIGALAVVSFGFLVAAGGDPFRGFVGAILGATFAAIAVHLAANHYRRHGRFVLDGVSGILRHYRAGRLVDEYAFNDVQRVWMSIDLTDGVRLSGPPSWLQIALRNGNVLRLAKGSKTELAPVCDAMKKLGFALG